MVKGKIKIRVLNKDSVKKEYSFNNLITNRGRSSVNEGGFGEYISIGRGSHVESPTLERLANHVITKKGSWNYLKRNVIDVDVNEIVNEAEIKVLFNPERENVIYSELGITDSSGNLYTYSLMKDAQGNTTTITVLKGEQIEISYVIEYIFPYKTEDRDKGITAYIHNVPELHRMRAGNYNSSQSSNRFRFFQKEVIDMLNAGMVPNTSGGLNNGYYFKRGNRYGARSNDLSLQGNIIARGVHAEGYYEYNDFDISFLFEEDRELSGEKSSEFYITVPYL